MITSEVQVYNLAVSAVGGTGNIASTQEESREAEVCRLWFGPVRDRVLRAAHWPCAKTFSRLAELAQNDGEDAWTELDPEPGYTYAFHCPSDMLIPRYITTFERFSLSTYSPTRQAISCQNGTPILCYTKRQTNVAQWDISLGTAITAALAARICSQLTGKNVKARSLLEEANSYISTAREEAGNASSEMQGTIPSWILARGYANPAVDLRYFYPLDNLLSPGDIGG